MAAKISFSKDRSFRGGFCEVGAKFKSRYCALFYVFLISGNKFLSLFLFLFLEPEECVWVDMLEKNSIKNTGSPVCFGVLEPHNNDV